MLSSVTASGDWASGVHNLPISVTAPGVLANDYANGTYNYETMTYTPPGPMSAVLDSGPANGSVSLNSDGSYIYTPNQNFFGYDSFTYHATADSASSDVVTVWLNVTNSAPWTNDRYLWLTHNQVLDVSTNGLVSSPTDWEGDPITAVLVENVQHGTLDLHADGTFTYTPNHNFVGYDTFTYNLTDGLSTSPYPGRVSFNVTNDSPWATDRNYSLGHNQSLDVSTSGLVSSPFDGEGDPITALLVDNVQHGTLNFHADGTFTYTPSYNFVGYDSFTYNLTDGLTTTFYPGRVSFNVTNAAPWGTGATYTVLNTETLVVAAPGVLQGAFDQEGDSLTASLITPPSHGTLTFSSNGSFSYAANTGYVGSDFFTYSVSDGINTSWPIMATLNVVPGGTPTPTPTGPTPTPIGPTPTPTPIGPTPTPIGPTPTPTGPTPTPIGPTPTPIGPTPTPTGPTPTPVGPTPTPTGPTPTPVGPTPTPIGPTPTPVGPTPTPTGPTPTPTGPTPTPTGPTPTPVGPTPTPIGPTPTPISPTPTPIGPTPTPTGPTPTPTGPTPTPVGPTPTPIGPTPTPTGPTPTPMGPTPTPTGPIPTPVGPTPTPVGPTPTPIGTTPTPTPAPTTTPESSVAPPIDDLYPATPVNQPITIDVLANDYVIPMGMAGQVVEVTSASGSGHAVDVSFADGSTYGVFATQDSWTGTLGAEYTWSAANLPYVNVYDAATTRTITWGGDADGTHNQFSLYKNGVIIAVGTHVNYNTVTGTVLGAPNFKLESGSFDVELVPNGIAGIEAGIPPHSHLHIGLNLVDGLYDEGDPTPVLQGAGGMTVEAGDRTGLEIAGWQTNSNTHGTVDWNSDHTQLVYTPTAGYVGIASFTYTILGNGVPIAGTATVVINVNNPVSPGPKFVAAGTVDVQLPATGTGNLTVLATLPITEGDGGTVTATWVETPETWTSHYNSMALIQANLKTDVVGNTVRIGITNASGVNVNYLDGAVFRITIQNGAGSDTVLVHFYNPAIHTAPTFYPSSYIFYISDATENGDTIGRLTATDRDSLQVNYSFGVTLSSYIAVNSTGDVKVTDATGLRSYMRSVNLFSFAGTAIATNSALLAGNASVTIKLRNDPQDMDSAIERYINAWYDYTINNATNTNEIAKLVISANIGEIVADWETWRANFNDSTNLIWAVSGFSPVPKSVS